MFKPPAELTAEAKVAEETMLKLRRRVWQGEEVGSREVIDAAMRTCDLLCKLSSRAEKAPNRDTAGWLQQTRKSMRAMLREYWTDVLEQRRALYPVGDNGATMVPIR